MIERFAVLNGNVAENIVKASAEHAASQGWIAIPDDFGVGDAFVGNIWRKPDPTKAELIALAADARWSKETGGIEIQGIPVDTTRDSQAMINGASNLVSAEPSSIIKFKAKGEFVELDAAAMTAIAVAVGQHVQAVFATEAQVLTDIEAGTITTRAQIDAAFNGDL